VFKQGKDTNPEDLKRKKEAGNTNSRNATQSRAPFIFNLIVINTSSLNVFNPYFS
jgi:hypothetical protein